MMLNLMRFIFALGLAVSLPASAGGYFGASGTYAMGEVSSVDVDFGAATLKLGATVGDYFSVEARGLLGIIDYDYGYEAVSLDSVITGLMKVGPNNGKLQPYLAVGASRTAITISGPYGSLSNSDTDLSYGFGATAFSDAGVGLNIEYVSYYNKNNLSLSAFSIGFIKQF